MQIIQLLPRLPAQADLLALNQRLQQGEICLDWREVSASVAVEELTTLFAGLNLAEHFELIGGETIPEALMPAVLAAFEASSQQAPGKQAESVATEQAGPELWLPANETLQEPETETDIEVQEKTEIGALALKQAATPSEKLLKSATATELRAELETMVMRDLLGPAGGEEEEVNEFRVHDRYLIGILAPNSAQVPAEEMDNQENFEEGADEQGSNEKEVAQTSSRGPTSMGFSFSVNREASLLQVTVKWGHYQRIDRATKEESQSRQGKVWKRTPRGGLPWFITVKEGPIAPWQPEPEEQPDVFVKGIIRSSIHGWTVTLFLVNGQSMPKRSRDQAYLFQPELIVEAPGGGPIFQRRAAAIPRQLKPEDKALAMLYRKQVSFAVGHGVSVHAETRADDPTCAVRLSTRFAPVYEVPRTEAPTISELPALAELVLDMQNLAEAEVESLQASLQPLVTAYAGWISEQGSRLSPDNEDLKEYREEARIAIQHCQSTLTRIQAGINLLSKDPDAASAFRFMNRAMWQQRIHSLHADELRRQGTLSLSEIDIPSNRSWRPFQLAFILLNIASLTDLSHPERSSEPDAIADLLWFPTGGGKTEAYLGLTAYTLAIRRLQGTIEGRSGLDGVAVIMRYTLRLLTLQQFQRASALICACELIRRSDPGLWGETPFRLGLWVGQSSTPNRTADSAQAVIQSRGNQWSNSGNSNPRQLTNCPWCGAAIDAGKDLIVESHDKGRGRTLIFCSDGYGQCEFSRRKSSQEGLPVVVVDEEIYRLLPALLIATVDKFAQLPWKGETQMLFGQVDKYCERHGFRSPEIKDSDSHRAINNFKSARSYAHSPLRPPDLIIQDELHLISGPLGTLAGLYETVIDKLATWQVNGRAVRPKVIAATATIRQASEQVRALFMRRVAIFPPQGLDVEDNFFSRQRRPEAGTPGRRYLGICANGRRMKAAQIRVYLAYLAAAQVLLENYGARAADPWMTLVGYFNSMSDLGSMRHLVDDDITNRIWKMDQRGLAKRRQPKVSELTSRINSTDIPGVLNNLEQSFEVKESLRPIDVLLATNMISVGVDVPRLSLMVVTGQPKTTAEYIQATSRVGRREPGLVCIVYKWNRPRDLSHYEQFEHYHATFYQQVEALSITPFAPRALDRGLAALLTSFMRLASDQYNKNDSAGLVNQEAQFQSAIDAIMRRAEEIAASETIDVIKSDLHKLRNYWLERARRLPSLGYKKQNDSITLNLLKEPRRGKWEPFTCLNSLRNVEPTVQLLLDEGDLGRPGIQTNEEIMQEESE